MKNIPNILSAIRICLVPAFVLAYFKDSHDIKIYAALVYALASFTDFLDGYLARKMQVTSNLGKVLDPLGDKLMTFAVLLCITIDNVIPTWAVIVFFVKEFMMLLGGLVIHRIAKFEIPPSNYIGKASTVFFFVVCVVLMLFRSIPAETASTLIGIAIGIMLMALGSYIMTFLGVMMKAKNKKHENN